MQSEYYQVADGVNSEPSTSGRGKQLGIVLFSGLGLALLSITAHSLIHPHTISSVAETTNLVGLSPSLRTSSAAWKPSITPATLPGSGPFKEIALAALEAHNARWQCETSQCVRDVSVWAMLNKDVQTKAAVAEVQRSTAIMHAEAAQLAKEEPASMDFKKNMAGVTAPMGFWDPFGLSADLSEGKLLFWREAELKHGRVCMLAFLGMAVGEKYHPLFGGVADDVPAYMVFGESSLKLFWAHLTVILFFLESLTLQNMAPRGRAMKPEYETGFLNFDPLGIKPTDPKALKETQTKELNNGRLAMLATAGIIAQEMVTGEKIFGN